VASSDRGGVKIKNKSAGGEDLTRRLAGIPCLVEAFSYIPSNN
jgi:hypothetical protein